jgi:hypothetical protein
MNGTKTSRKRAATGRITLPPARMSASESALAMALRKVDMKGAVKAAIACVEGFFPEAKDILLEEVELRQGHYENSASEGRIFKQDPLWRVVVSFKSGKPGKLSEVMGGDPRLYREVYIEPDSGSLRSMRNWGR